MAWAEWVLAPALPPTALLMSCCWVWGSPPCCDLCSVYWTLHHPGTTVDFIYLHVSTVCKDLEKTRLLKRKSLSMAGHIFAWTSIFTGVSLLLWQSEHVQPEALGQPVLLCRQVPPLQQPWSPAEVLKWKLFFRGPASQCF